MLACMEKNRVEQQRKNTKARRSLRFRANHSVLL